MPDAQMVMPVTRRMISLTSGSGENARSLESAACSWKTKTVSSAGNEEAQRVLFAITAEGGPRK